MKQLFRTVYGSHLYGTNTPTSDRDEKVVYLPPFEDVLLGKRLRVYKERFDAEGNVIADDNQPMPDNGVETEFVPFQTFTRDYLNGQTYALEIVQAHGHKANAPQWMKDLINKFTTCNVASMAGFAMKQTFDYVHRGARLEAARALRKAVVQMDDELLCAEGDPKKTYRLDSDFMGRKFLHVLAERVDVKLGTSVNNNKTMETLKLNGREYLETTTVEHLLGALDKLIASYGTRSTQAALADFDLKSLSHAVRVYEQAIELLSAGKITFPRVNAEYLLNVKQGRLDLEEVKAKLLQLDEQVTELQAGSKMLREKTEELEAEFEKWLLNQLVELYKISDVGSDY